MSRSYWKPWGEFYFITAKTRLWCVGKELKAFGSAEKHAIIRSCWSINIHCKTFHKKFLCFSQNLSPPALSNRLHASVTVSTHFPRIFFYLSLCSSVLLTILPCTVHVLQNKVPRKTSKPLLWHKLIVLFVTYTYAYSIHVRLTFMTCVIIPCHMNASITVERSGRW